MNDEEIKEGALAFIASQKTMVVATAGKDGIPHAATLYFLVDEHLNLYFATGSETKKVEHLTHSKKIAFVIGTGPDIVTVQGGGSVEQIKESDLVTIEKVGKELYDKATKEWPVLRIGHTGISYFKLKPEWMVWLSLDKKAHPDSYYPDYHKVI